MEVENGKIGSTSLGWGGGAPFLTAFLLIAFESSGQGFGGYSLDAPIRDAHGEFLRREGVGWGMEWIGRVLSTLEVDEWEKLPGTIVRVRRDEPYGDIVAIGHAYKDRWFTPKIDLAHMLREGK